GRPCLHPWGSPLTSGRCGLTRVGPRRNLSGELQRDFAAALPPLRPAALCCAVVPPCFALPPLPDPLPPCLEASGEFAILAARSLDIPLSLSASYCFSFFTCAVLLRGIALPPHTTGSIG